MFSLNRAALQDDDEPAAASFHRNVGNTKLSGQGVLLMYVLLLKDRPITVQEWMDLGVEMSHYGYDVSGHTLRGRHSANKKLLETDGSVDAGLTAEVEAVESALLKRRRASSSKAKPKEAAKAKAVAKVENDSEEDVDPVPTKNSKTTVEAELDNWPYEDFPTPDGGYKWSDFGFVDEEDSENKRIRPAFGGDAANDDEASAASSSGDGGRMRKRKGNEAAVLMYVVLLKNCTISRQEWDATSTEMSKLGVGITGNALRQRHNANRRLLSAEGATLADAPVTPKKRGVKAAKATPKKEKPIAKVQARDEYSEGEDANTTSRKKLKTAVEIEPEPDSEDRMSEGTLEQFRRLMQERELQGHIQQEADEEDFDKYYPDEFEDVDEKEYQRGDQAYGSLRGGFGGDAANDSEGDTPDGFSSGSLASTKRWDGDAERVMYTLLLRNTTIAYAQWTELSAEMSAEYGYALTDRALRTHYVENEKRVAAICSGDGGASADVAPFTPMKRARGSKATPKSKSKSRKPLSLIKGEDANDFGADVNPTPSKKTQAFGAGGV